MLKRTSKHHQPAHLAAAVALGVVVGLVPKASLLAVALYAGLLLLPIHTWLALAVSLVVGCVANYLDPLTHVLGIRLLQQRTLSPLWYFLDNTAILPWLGLHNTVVLGSLAIGIAQAGPTYLVAYRLFDRMRWGTPARVRYQETVELAPQPIEPAIVPPPKFIRLPATARPIATASNAMGEEEFEPAHAAAAIVNSWHMGLAADKSGRQSVVSGVSGASRPAAHASIAHPATTGDMAHRSNDSLHVSFPLSSLDLPPRPQSAERSEIVDSLDLAHSASDVLAWVDDMLDECLSEDRTRIVARDSHAPQLPPLAGQSAPPTAPLMVGGAGEEQWLMETTIEVVRWGEGAPPAIQPSAAPGSSHGPSSDGAQSGQAQSAQVLAAQNEGQPSSAQMPVAGRIPLSDCEDGQARPGQAEGGRASIVQFVQYMQRSAKSTGTAQPEGQSQAGSENDAQRGECLGYLLGHLRQEREGRSS